VSSWSLFDYDSSGCLNVAFSWPFNGLVLGRLLSKRLAWHYVLSWFYSTERLARHHAHHGFIRPSVELGTVSFHGFTRLTRSAPCPSWFYLTKHRAWHHVLSWFYSTECLARHHAHHGFIRSSASLGTMSIMILFDRAPSSTPCPSWFYSTEHLARHHDLHGFIGPSI